MFFNVNTFLKSVFTSKSRVTYDLDTDRVTYDLNTDLDTTTHKIIGIVWSPLYLATPVSTAFRNLIFHCSWKRILCLDSDSRVFSINYSIFVNLIDFIFLASEIKIVYTMALESNAITSCNYGTRLRLVSQTLHSVIAYFPLPSCNILFLISVAISLSMMHVKH